ncbi:hypothetical protein ACFLIM_40205 [Nonomuraea sp. M3C6]|uniref:Aldehyde dehydrogenase family protein n=1 Tax=Nonomuraea marmarensis TaxID=3351344 RepID=A0ABW7APU5_9ACTN
MTTVRNLIGGERVSEPEPARHNPADPAAMTPSSDASAVHAAVSAAEQAQAAWPVLPTPARGTVYLGRE